ncbi:MAG: hypothetical protein RIQ56_871, partial [Candidatus Parcubacteria bacterium]
MRSDPSVFRLRLLSLAFIAFSLLLIARLYFVQIVHGEEYAKNAFSQYVAQAPDVANRGTIFFTEKDGTLTTAAVMQTGWRVAIVPKDIENADEIYEMLNAITPVDKEKFDASAAKTNDPYEEILFRVPNDIAKKIRSKKMPGVLLVQDGWRFYPAKDLAAQTIGFVAFKGDAKVGVYGLERQWQDTLAESHMGTYVNPFAEIFANVGAMISSDTSGLEGDVVTTIEPTVQRKLESTLDSVMEEYSPRLSGGI